MALWDPCSSPPGTVNCLLCGCGLPPNGRPPSLVFLSITHMCSMYIFPFLCVLLLSKHALSLAPSILLSELPSILYKDPQGQRDNIFYDQKILFRPDFFVKMSRFSTCWSGCIYKMKSFKPCWSGSHLQDAEFNPSWSRLHL
jgi:hypothetical protein